MKLLGIDYGTKRVGIAVSNEEGTMAFPKSVLHSGPKLAEEIAKLCKDENIEAVVIGESKDFKNVDNPIMEEVQALKNEINALVRLPIYLEPELMTSAEAEHIQGKNKMHDASAAAIILQSHINRTQNVH